MTTMILHPSAIELAGNLALEFNLWAGHLYGDPETWYRAKWDAIATGEIKPDYAFECGVGHAATAAFCERELRQCFANAPDDLATVLAWLRRWVSDHTASAGGGEAR